jgi:ABC-2 type transport system ATP-binding protein
MIEVKTENLVKKFESTTAINHISFEVEQGKIVGLIGPDGAGKTTLLRLLAALLKPTSGSIFVDGVDILKYPQQIKGRIGYMPQHFSLYGDLTVSENLKFFADLYGVPQPRFKARKEELLQFSGLAPFEDRLSRNLSGGMQKKLALSSNLFHTPKILLLDEPTTGVDPVSRRDLWKILYKLNAEGATLILTTPYMDEASKCHEVGLLYEGTILTYKPPQSLIQEMKDEIIELVADQEQARKAIKNLPGLKWVYPFGGTIHLVFESDKQGLEKAKKALDGQGVQIQGLKRISPSFEDVFLALVQEERTGKKDKNVLD